MSIFSNKFSIGTPSQGDTYYISLRVINTGSLAKQTILRYQGPQGLEELDVAAGQVVMKEIVFTSVIQPATVEIVAFEKITSLSVKLNGQNSVLVNPSLTKDVTEIALNTQGNLWVDLICLLFY